MSIEELVLQGLRSLPREKQGEVLQFIESLKGTNGPRQRLRSLEGLWADLAIEITEDEINAARREIWSNFPRDMP